MENKPAISVAKLKLRQWLVDNEYEHSDSHISISAERSLPHLWVGYLRVRSIPGMIYELRYDRAVGEFELTVYEERKQ